jgi:hypothetical protein
MENKMETKELKRLLKKITNNKLSDIESLYVKEGGYSKLGNFRNFLIKEITLTYKVEKELATEVADFIYWNN